MTFLLATTCDRLQVTENFTCNTKIEQNVGMLCHPLLSLRRPPSLEIVDIFGRAMTMLTRDVSVSDNL